MKSSVDLSLVSRLINLGGYFTASFPVILKNLNAQYDNYVEYGISNDFYYRINPKYWDNLTPHHACPKS